MDIREAKKAAGTVSPTELTPEKEMRGIPAESKEGMLLSPTMDFGADAVIAEYLRYLEDNGVTRDDISEALAAIISSGNVTWSFDLLGSIPVEFQIRASWVNDYLLEILDEEVSDANKVSMVRYNNIVSVCNLAASLTRLRDQRYTIDTKEDFHAARKRVQELPYVLQNALINKLAVFDRTIAVAMSDWAVKNFTKPQKEK